jgi:diketogulonate reductase-like aldo/keto reductase
VFLETKIRISDYGDDQTLRGFDKSAGKLGVERIAENIDVFDFELTDEQLAAIDDLDTDRRGGPDPSEFTLESFGRAIPED